MIFGIEMEPINFDACRAERLKDKQAEADLASRLLGVPVEIYPLPE